jgi:hypothetical protein
LKEVSTRSIRSIWKSLRDWLGEVVTGRYSPTKSKNKTLE